MSPIKWKNEKYIATWDVFDRQVRSKGYPLLKSLDKFPNSILVTGCQRSGTTMLARVIIQSSGMENYWFGADDELDAALILSGYVDLEPEGRYCFQTTYLNEGYGEYFKYSEDHKIIWILRNPYSVVNSMLNNWQDFGINQVFNACGVPYLTGKDKWLYRIFGLQGITKVRRACWAYYGKTRQLFELKQGLDSDSMLIVDYDELVEKKEIILPNIYGFIKLPYQEYYAKSIHSGSINKAEKLSKQEISSINLLCEPIYQRAKNTFLK